MNLAEPSGSSPPEKPPGIKTIWALRMALSRAAVDWRRSSAVRLRMFTVSASIPARRQARTESYSQLVPGNTGMTTRGRAILDLHTAGERSAQEMASTGAALPARVGYTSSSTLSLRESSSSMEAESPLTLTTASAVVWPMSWPPSHSSVSWATMAPGMGASQSRLFSTLAKPMELPKVMFMTASPRPFSTAQAASTLPA